MTTILAFDPGMKTGWCHMIDGVPEDCGTLPLPDVAPEEYGALGWALEQWIESKIVELSPHILGFESPWIPLGNQAPGKKIFTTHHSLRRQMVLATVIEVTAMRHGRVCREVESRTAKKRLLGKGSATDKEMIIAARRAGWPAVDDHQAAACAVGIVVHEDFLLEMHP